MKRSIAVVFVMIGISFGLGAQVAAPTFSAGTAISASSMNAYLGSLVTAINALQAQVDAGIPVGTVIASFTAPDASGNYMTGSTIWALADGSKPADATSYAGLFPDLRGQFIRGVNMTRADGYQDPDSASRTGGDSNKAGSLEDDALQQHKHNQILTSVPGGSAIAGIATAFAISLVSQYGYGDVGGVGNFSSETRPTNVAVYWYIKVK